MLCWQHRRSLRSFCTSMKTCPDAQSPMHPEAHFLVQMINALNTLVTKIGLWVPLKKVLGSPKPRWPGRPSPAPEKSGSFESRVLASAGRLVSGSLRVRSVGKGGRQGYDRKPA